VLEKVEIDWKLDKSDHSSLKCCFWVTEESEKGREIVGLNSKLMENENTLVEIKQSIATLLSQIPESWNPHTKLEFMKVAVRSGFAEVAKKVNSNRKSEVEILEEKINSLINIKLVDAENSNSDEERSNNIEAALLELKQELELERQKQDTERSFKSGVKWYEEGEKSNKYFLGLMKAKAKQKLISKIKDEGIIFNTKESVMNCIKSFYQKLYKEVKISSDIESNLFNLCPKLEKDSVEDLDRNITLEELRNTIKHMKDSAPGPDGITYSVYKNLWPMLGPFIVNACIQRNYGESSPFTQRISVNSTT
jgi:hypothetical protein